MILRLLLDRNVAPGMQLYTGTVGSGAENRECGGAVTAGSSGSK